jgi:hypothetical protein
MVSHRFSAGCRVSSVVAAADAGRQAPGVAGVAPHGARHRGVPLFRLGAWLLVRGHAAVSLRSGDVRAASSSARRRAAPRPGPCSSWKSGSRSATALSGGPSLSMRRRWYSSRSSGSPTKSSACIRTPGCAGPAPVWGGSGSGCGRGSLRHPSGPASGARPAPDGQGAGGLPPARRRRGCRMPRRAGRPVLGCGRSHQRGRPYHVAVLGSISTPSTHLRP